MEKNICFILPLILLCTSIKSQTSSVRLEKKERIMADRSSDGVDHVVAEILNEYIYDAQGKEIRGKEIGYGDFVGDYYRGYKNEYDSFGNLIKRLYQNYNANVDLWVTRKIHEYFYDDNQCLIGELEYRNLVNNPNEIEWIYTNDNNCLKLEETIKWVISDTLEIQNKIFYTYSDNEISNIRKSFFESIGTNITEERVEEFFYNQYGDVEFELYYNVNPDTSIIKQKIHYYTYEFLENGWLGTKKDEVYVVFNPPLDTIFESQLISSYEYDCQGNLITESNSVSTHISITIGNTFEDSTTYFYSGENNCFNHKENLELKIFPNPTSDFIKISSPIFGSGDTNVRIMDLVGRVIFDQLVISRFPEFSVDLKEFNLPTGIFVVQLQSDKYQVSEKVLFQN